MTDQDSVVVGRIGRAHGVRGEVSVDVRTDAPETRFAVGAVLTTDQPGLGPLTVSSTRAHHGRLLIAFDGVEDRDQAEQLRGAMLLIPTSELGDPGEGAFWDHQLIGLDVLLRATDGNHPRIGEVTDVVHLTAQQLLAVKLITGAEVLVPFVEAIVPVVDLRAGHVVLDPPEGLLE